MIQKAYAVVNIGSDRIGAFGNNAPDVFGWGLTIFGNEEEAATNVRLWNERVASDMFCVMPVFIQSAA